MEVKAKGSMYALLYVIIATITGIDGFLQVRYFRCLKPTLSCKKRK
jgi:hypothetical protein